MSSRMKRRSIVNTEEESEDLFASQKSKKHRITETEKENDTLQDDSLFGELISKAGYILKKGDQPNLLSCDQSMFQRNLRWSLKSHSLYRMPEIAKKFVKGLEDHVEHPFKLKWALLYTQTVKDCVTARGGHQDSLIRMCLNIEELQPCLIGLLTEKLLEIANDDEESSSQANIPNLILANLKWLDCVKDSDTLTANIIEILEGSPVKVQQEVINFAPNIVDDANHPRIAEVLCQLYDTTPELTPAILDTLGHLTLAPETLEDVRHSVLKTLQATRPEQLPVVIKFLLNNAPHSMAYQVLSDIREKINLPEDTNLNRKSPKKRSNNTSACYNNQDDVAYKILLFSHIKMATITHKFLITAWLKAIQDVYDVASVKPLDFLILLILHDAAPSQRRPIESIFRNKIRTGLFSDTILEKIFTNHGTVLRENFEPLKKMASLLLRSSELLISQTGATLYRLCFLHLDGYQRQEIVLALLKHLGDNFVVRLTALSLLSSLAHEHTAALSKFTVFLKGSLDMVDELGMGEVKRLLDVVSLLVYSDSSHAALQDELVILVRKQLSHSDLKYKLIGVLNAALAVKNMVGADESQDSRESVSGVNTSLLKEAENLLHLVLSSTAKSPTASALFMDEMASITLKEGMNSKLEEWVCEKMTDDFQETFVLDYAVDSQPPEDLFPLAVCWNLEDFDDKGIIINLAPMVIKAEFTRNDPAAKESKLVFLAPQFRLLRMLESRLHNGDLSNIDALLGCPVYGPATLVFDKFESHSKAEQHAALSCLFYTINWFHELINAFVTQKDNDLKQKVFSRLQQVIQLQNMVSQFLPKCQSYIPPLAVFDLDTSTVLPTFTTSNPKKVKKGQKQATEKGKKRKGKGNDNNTEGTQLGTQVHSQSTSQPTTQPLQSQPEGKDSDVTQVTSTVNMTTLRPFLRELHMDVFCLLFRKLALDTEMKAQGHLTLSEAEFLLTDLNFKLVHVFGTGNKCTLGFNHGTEKSIGYSHLDLFTPAEVAQRAHRFLKPVCVHLEAISGFFQSLIADNDGIMDAPGIFSEKTRPLIKVNSLLFTTLSVFLSWTGLQQEENKQTLTAVLQTIAKKLEGEVVSSMGQEELISTVFRYISNFHSSVVSIETAAVLMQTLVALMALPSHEDFSEKIVEAIEELLKREWYTTGGEREKGAAFNQHVHTLLKEYLKQSKNPLSLIDAICSKALVEFMEAPGRDPHSDAFPTLTKGTLGGYYHIMISFLVSGTKKSLSSKSSTSSDNTDCLMVWDTAIKIFHTLVMILKKSQSRYILGSCLKYARSFLDLFLRSAMPLMDSCLRKHNQEVVTLLKSLQASTRFLQHVCTHSKANQDTSLTRHVPLIRKSLEMLVYRVKAMLALNKCSNAFWMGNLKNRDLQGEELLSQSMQEAEKDEDEQEEGDEEEEDVNDNQSDVDLDEDENSKTGREEEEEEESAEYSASF